MNRRRMMMQQLISSVVDYLEGYRLSYRSGYKIESVWQDSNTLTLKHTSAGFMGPRTAYQIFFGTSQGASTGISVIMPSTPLATVDTSKCYRLTLTVLRVNSNSATDESSGDLEIAIGRSDGYETVSTPLCNIAVGTKIVVETPNPSYTICAGVFGSNNANTIWNFDFDVKFEEVQSEQIHTNLEVTEGDIVLCNIGNRDFIKLNSGLAICAIINTDRYWMPILVSEIQAAVTYKTSPAQVETFDSVTSIEYEGKKYYVSHYQYAMANSTIVSNPYNLPVLNKVLDKDAYANNVAGQQEAARDLLDYYFGKV